MKILKSKVNSWLLFVITCVFLCVQFFNSCVVGNEPEGLMDNFGIYLLKDTTLKYWQVINVDIDSLKLRDKPWLSDKIIDYYDFSSHCIYLKVEKSYFIAEYNPMIDFLSRWSERPFIVVANGKNRYVGRFFQSYYMPFPSAIIGTECIYWYAKDILLLGSGTLVIKDTRNNNDVKKALIESGKYRGGLQVTLDSIKIKKADTSIVEYSIIIKNIDQDNLYVLDPEKAGTGRFNYYGNWLVIYDRLGNKKYRPVQDTVTSPQPNDITKIERNWFTKLESGKSLTRWFTRKKYTIPQGIFYIYFDYEAVKYDVEKNKRILEDGRIWVGPTRSNILDVTINNNNYIINNRNVILE